MERDMLLPVDCKKAEATNKMCLIQHPRAAMEYSLPSNLAKSGKLCISTGLYCTGPWFDDITWRTGEKTRHESEVGTISEEHKSMDWESYWLVV